MANVHGFNNFNQEQNAMGANEALLQREARENRIPFMNTLKSNRRPLDETIPYTLKIVWCPSISFTSIALYYTIAIWVMYIVCCVKGISKDPNSGILAPYPETLKKYGALWYQSVKAGQIWRLITAGFLHVDLLHITMNSISLLFLLTRLEIVYSPLIMIPFTLCSLVSGTLMSVTINSEDTLSVGSSTVIYGVFGGLLAFMAINWTALGHLRSQLCCIIGIILFVSILFSFTGGVDLAAHFGGLIGGFFCGLALFPGIQQKKKYFGAIGAGFLAAYFLVMFLVFFLAS